MPEDALIAVAMSGGVDSSVAAGLLAREGAPVVGLTMQLWNQRRLPEISAEGATGRCCSLDDVYDARRVAERIGIPFYVVNFEDRFERDVVRPFIDEYLAGRTPVPCTLCNNFLKFDQLLEMAASLGAARLATGHYARIRRDEATGRWLLARAVDASRDQTYFLWGLTQEQLCRIRFPLGEFHKTDVREMALEMGLPVAAKGDSQEICFVPNGDYAAFIDAYFREQGNARESTRGEIVTADGRTLGEHEGVHHYTVGQRRGLHIAAGEPLYVISTDPASQRVIVGRNEDLLCRETAVESVNWIACDHLAAPVRAAVRIRNKHTPAPATIEPGSDPARVTVRFDEPQRAVTPGQAAVFYDGDLVLGGGWIGR
jgi:tRNA-specific 2-thiouridylase